MKSVSKFLVALAALAAYANVAPAHAEMCSDQFPMQHQIEARQIIAAHPLNTMAIASQSEELTIDTVINFPTASDKLSPTAKVQIKHVAAKLKSHAFSGGHVIVSGYTDSAGKPERNQRLSYHRALRVMHALIADGVPATMLSAQGYGSETPVASNSTADGRAMNRRVSFMVVTPAD